MVLWGLATRGILYTQYKQQCTHIEMNLSSTPPHPFQGVYNFAHSCPEVSHDFTLMSNFPRKELHCTPNGGPLLSELGLGTKCALYIKDNSA